MLLLLLFNDHEIHPIGYDPFPKVNATIFFIYILMVIIVALIVVVVMLRIMIVDMVIKNISKDTFYHQKWNNKVKKKEMKNVVQTSPYKPFL